MDYRNLVSEVLTMALEESLLESKKLNENALLKANVDSIEIEATPYDMYRMLQAVTDPGNYTNNTSVGSNGIMLFNDAQEKEKTISVLKKMGIKFKDQAMNDAKDLPPENTKSPYPSNNGVVKY